MNVLASTLLVVASLLQTGAPAVSTDEAHAYFAELYRDRAQITQGYVEYTVTTEKPDKREPTREGSVMTFRQWFGPGSRRTDVDEERPKDPKSALKIRCSYDAADGTYRFIDLDRPDYSVREYTRAYPKKDEGHLGYLSKDNYLDPRLLGGFGIDYELLQHEHLEDLKMLDPRGIFSVEHIQHDGRPARRIKVSYPDGMSYTYVVPDGSLLPIHLTTQFVKNSPDGRPSPDIHVDIDLEVAVMTNDRGERFSYPRLLKIRRVTEGEVDIAQNVAVTKANFNVPVPPDVLTWKALNPQVGVFLNVNAVLKGTSKEVATWDGEKFALKAFSTDPSRSTSEDDGPSTDAATPLQSPSLFRLMSQLALAGGVFLVVVLLALKFFRPSVGKPA